MSGKRFLHPRVVIASRTEMTNDEMTNDQLKKLLCRYDPGESVVPQTSLRDRRRRRRTFPASGVNNWLRAHAALNVRTRRRVRALFRRGAWALVLAGAAYLGYLALVEDNRHTEQGGVALDDKQQVTISSPATHSTPPEERSLYSPMTMPPDLVVAESKDRPPPAVSSGGNVAAPASDGGYVVQVSAERSDTAAQASLKTLQSRHPGILGGHSPLIRRVDLGEKGVVYRAQIGPFDTMELAKQFCARLKAAGARCIVQKNS